MTQSSHNADVKGMPDKPYQPYTFPFPSCSFGKTTPVKRSFQPSWFHRFQWIHYDAGQDAAFCFFCCKAVKQGKVRLTGVTEEFHHKGVYKLEGRN